MPQPPPSSQLDKLDISEADKQQLGSGMQGMAMAWINSFVWGSVIAGIGLLVLFNFARSG